MPTILKNLYHFRFPPPTQLPQLRLFAGHSGLMTHHNIVSVLRMHAHGHLMPVPTVGLYDVPERVAHEYADTLIELLLQTLADADPWHETYGMEDRTVDGDRFGYPEAFTDLITCDSLLYEVLTEFSPVKRDPTSLEEKSRLISWLAMRHRIIATRLGAFDAVAELARFAADCAARVPSRPSWSSILLLYTIQDAEYFEARSIIHPPPTG